MVIASVGKVIVREAAQAAGQHMPDEWLVPCLVVIMIAVVIGVIIQKNR